VPAGDPPDAGDVDNLKSHTREVIREHTCDLRSRSAPVRVAVTSKTFKQLARLTGAPKANPGPYVCRTLRRDRLRDKIPKLAERKTKHRARLRGVSKSRAAQILAGAIVAEAAMTVLDLESVDVCPWAIREGVICHRMAKMPILDTDDLDDLLEIRPAAPEIPETPQTPQASEAAKLVTRS
jgi:exopolyphosphatase/guanosine-5'-triphosphate,3'-diphosphate pyrophosphatase